MRILISFLSLFVLSKVTQAQPILYRADIIHTISGQSVANGEMLVNGSRIVSVGKNIANKPEGTHVVDLKGMQLYPGLIAATTSLGLTEINAVRATQDTTEVGEFTPDVEAWISVNPDSELIPVTRANGITHALVVPLGGTVTGTSGLIKLAGWGVEDMTVAHGVALHLRWPAMGINTRPKESLDDASKYKSPKEQDKERNKKLKRIDEFFNEAQAYAKARVNGGDNLKSSPAWDAMLPALEGKKNIMVHANDLRQIKAAISWAKSRKYQIIIAGARDAWMCAELLAQQKVPVIFDGTFDLPARDTDPYDIHFRAASILTKAGVRVSLSSKTGSWGTSKLRNLPYAAAQCAAHGLSHVDALKTITLHPAQTLGVADRLGSLEAKKEATFIAVTGDILDIRNNVKRMWIGGEEVSLESRHTRLYEKYRKRPRPPARKK